MRRLLRAGKYGGTTNPVGRTSSPGGGIYGSGGLRIFQSSIDCETDETGGSICLVVSTSVATPEPLNTDAILRAIVSWGGADGGGKCVVDCRHGARINLEAAQTVSVEAQVIGTAGLVGVYQFGVGVLEGTIALPAANTFTEAPILFRPPGAPEVALEVPPFAKVLTPLYETDPAGVTLYTTTFWRSLADFPAGVNVGQVSTRSNAPQRILVPNVAAYYSIKSSGAGPVYFVPVFDLQI